MGQEEEEETRREGQEKHGLHEAMHDPGSPPSRPMPFPLLISPLPTIREFPFLTFFFSHQSDQIEDKLLDVDRQPDLFVLNHNGKKFLG